MQLDVYNTHMELYPYEFGDFPVIEDQFTAEDQINHEPVPCGYIISEGKLYLPRGASLSLLESTTKCKPRFILEDDESMQQRGFPDPIKFPRDDIQKGAIAFLTSDTHQLTLEAKTGFGKTFCVCYAITELREKAMIVTPTETIQLQWYETLRRDFRYREENVLILRGTGMIDAVLEGQIEPADVYLVSHATLHNYLMKTNGHMFHKMFQKLGIGIKIYDESHFNFGNILLIDFFTNTHRTWYLSATFSRSSKSEAVCFRRAFSSAESFGKKESEAIMPKHVVFHIRAINSNPPNRERAMMMSHPGFTAAKYGRYAFFNDPKDTAYNEIKKIVSECRSLEGKILIFVPLIDAIESIAPKIKKDFPDKSVSVYHSNLTKSEKETAKEKDIIISTLRSFGTGADILGLRVEICAEPFSSPLTTEQVIGRLRPFPGGLECHYFDIVDRSIPPCNWWFRARINKARSLVKSVLQQ